MDRFKVEEWMEFAETTLATGVRMSLAHSAHLEKLDAAWEKLAKATFPLVGKAVTLADVSVALRAPFKSVAEV